MILIPMTLREANEFITSFHRHNKAVRGHRFAIGVSDELLGLVAVVIVGRPVARKLQDGFTAEITRLCTRPDAPKNCCSMLYSASWRAWRAMGGNRLITYTLKTESGVSLRASGFKVIGETRESKEGAGWQSRINRDWQPVYGQQKIIWAQTV